MMTLVLIFVAASRLFAATVEDDRCDRLSRRVALVSAMTTAGTRNRCVVNVKRVLESFKRSGSDVSDMKVFLLYRQEVMYSGLPFYQDSRWMHLKNLAFQYEAAYHMIIVSRTHVYDTEFRGGGAPHEEYFMTVTPPKMYGPQEDPLAHLYAQALDAEDFLQRAELNPEWELEIAERARLTGSDRKRMPPLEGEAFDSVRNLLKRFQ